MFCHCLKTLPCWNHLQLLNCVAHNLVGRTQTATDEVRNSLLKTLICSSGQSGQKLIFWLTKLKKYFEHGAHKENFVDSMILCGCNKKSLKKGNKSVPCGHRIHVAWSPVWSFHSLWWFGPPWATGVGPLCFLNSTVNYQDILEHFLLPSADKLYGDSDFIFQQDLAPAHTDKGTKSWFKDHGVRVVDWPANSPDLNTMENLCGIVKRKMRDTRPNNADDLKAAIKATWASITPEQCHRLIASKPRCNNAVIHAKGGPTKYWVHRY